MRTRLACAVLALTAGAACTDTDSATSLHPEGPPMILQVRMSERLLGSQISGTTRTVFAFGTHPLAGTDEVHPVQTAVAVGNKLRIIMDELLAGNNLEEIQCRAAVDNDASPDYGHVPPGADPDDVARCAVEDDALRTSCPGSNAQSVCICRRSGGCSRGGTVVPEGQPVGVKDENLDGAADDTHFIDGAVGIQCGAISVPIDLVGSYWNPSGNQNRPAVGGLDALGPAIVLMPRDALPTSTTCGLVFAPGVVDKQGIEVCAPANGDLAAGCSPGDVSAFQFGVEPLAVATVQPSMDGQKDVMRNSILTYSVIAPVDPATIAGIQISPAPPAAPAISTTGQTLVIALPTGTLFAPLTEYTVTFPVTITDTYGQPLPQAKSFRFTTAP